LERCQSIEPIRSGPSRANLWQHIELDYLTATTGARHGGAPEVVAVAGKIDTTSNELVGKVFNALELPDDRTPGQAVEQLYRRCS
jgi:hypothetical protein